LKEQDLSMRYWVLLASAARAKVFLMTGESEPLQLVQEVDHPAGRAREQDLMSDSPGRYSKGGKGGILSSMEHKNTPHIMEEHRFAKQLAQILETGFERNEYQWVAIFAPAQFLGILRETVSANVHKRLAHSEAKDLVAMNTRQLPSHLAALYPVPITDAG
jgi:protein required for attachment to host cells